MVVDIDKTAVNIILELLNSPPLRSEQVKTSCRGDGATDLSSLILEHQITNLTLHNEGGSTGDSLEMNSNMFTRH